MREGIPANNEDKRWESSDGNIWLEEPTPDKVAKEHDKQKEANEEFARQIKVKEEEKKARLEKEAEETKNILESLRPKN